MRAGKLFTGDRATWNDQAEYRTTVVYEDWTRSAVQDALRLNVSYAIPVGK